MKQDDYSPKQTAAMKARVRRMRAQYRKRLTAAIIIFFILGAVAGVFAHRWYVSRTPDVAGTLQVNTPEPATPEPTAPEVTLAPQATSEAWAMSEDDQATDEDIFPEVDDDQTDSGAELDAFPEVGQLTDGGDAADEAGDGAEAVQLVAPGEKLEPQPNAGDEAEQPAPEADENRPETETEAELEAVSEDEPGAGTEAEPESPDVQAGQADAVPEAAEQDDDASSAANDTGYGPQVVAIVPYGESFTYTTEINAEGNARVEATNEPYETVCFTQSMKKYMRPTDYAEKYASQYKMQGDEAGVSFELTLIDYIGNTTIIPQNVVDVSLRSESGNTVEHGYQLMDAEIDGKSGISIATNTPTTFYKRFAYPNGGEDMKYLVITTYKNGQTQMILFELESDKPDPEPEIIYPVLQRGLVSDDVLNLQNRLAELGYLSATPDGTFGQKTEDAIKSAQAAFGMEQNGIADNAFQQRLYEGAAPTPGQGVDFVTLSEGSKGDAVVRLQKRLAELGYYNGKADGGYGPMMVAAVKRAQVDFGMEQTGVATSEFQRRAFADAADVVDPTGGTGYVILQKGSKGDAVVKLQLTLREQGYYNGKADGGYGPMMVEAVKKAQAAFGLEETGIADIVFQQHLYGSVNAPTEAPEEAQDGEAADTTTVG